jgi:hypothetical protein
MPLFQLRQFITYIYVIIYISIDYAKFWLKIIKIKLICLLDMGNKILRAKSNNTLQINQNHNMLKKNLLNSWHKVDTVQTSDSCQKPITAITPCSRNRKALACCCHLWKYVMLLFSWCHHSDHPSHFLPAISHINNVTTVRNSKISTITHSDMHRSSNEDFVWATITKIYVKRIFQPMWFSNKGKAL